MEARLTILFIDEVHRFNKAQQDAFLPYVENGTMIFIGATTENPSFELNSALLSRARAYALKRLTTRSCAQVDARIGDREHGLGEPDWNWRTDLRDRLARPRTAMPAAP